MAWVTFKEMPQDMVTGFQDPTGIASYQPYLDQISQQQLLDPAQGYKDFMSPYQREIIDTTMQDYDIQAGKGRQQIADNAYNVGAFGGARQGVQMAEYQTGSDRNRAALLAGLYGQGYQQALATTATTTRQPTTDGYLPNWIRTTRNCRSTSPRC